MTWEVTTQLATFFGVVAAIVFGFLSWLRARSAEGVREAKDGAQAAAENAAVLAKLGAMASDFTEIKTDTKEIRSEMRAYRDDQIRHDARIDNLESRVAALELISKGVPKYETR